MLRRAQQSIKTVKIVFNFLFFFGCLFIYFEKEREREWGRGRERIPRRLYTVSAEPNVGLKVTNHEIMT